MRIAILGATGRVGGEAVRQALGHGDDVVALAPDIARLGLTHQRLTSLPADVRDLDSLRAAVAGIDAAISAFGGDGAPRGLFAEGIGNLLYALAEAEVDRLVAVSAAGAFLRSDPNLPLGQRLRSFTDRACLDDLEAMERRIMASGLVWTILRPARLTDGPLTGRYRTGLDGRALPKGREISRADVAAFALKALTSPLYERRAITLAY